MSYVRCVRGLASGIENTAACMLKGIRNRAVFER